MEAHYNSDPPRCQERCIADGVIQVLFLLSGLGPCVHSCLINRHCSLCNDVWTGLNSELSLAVGTELPPKISVVQKSNNCLSESSLVTGRYEIPGLTVINLGRKTSDSRRNHRFPKTVSDRDDTALRGFDIWPV